MSVRISLTDESLTAYLSGEIDHHSAKPIRDEIDQAAERGRPKDMVLDFRDVSFMDSSGIGLVMGRYALMQGMGGKLRAVNMSTHIRRVMRLAGLDRLAVMETAAKGRGAKNNEER